MIDSFDKAENWRRRAAELRGIADHMSEPAATSSLREIAASLEQHAGKLEEVTLKVRCLRPSRDVVWRRAG
jgi:hypothetical protein